ncbi:hypothetical protein LguiA_026496 [Lonicera macranthoides]
MTGATMSPAEIGELIIMNRSSLSRALKSVISVLQSNGGDARTSGKLLGWSDNSSSRMSTEVSGESGAVFGKDSSVRGVREFRKLYGLFKIKSSNSFGPLDYDSGMIEW